MNILITAPRGKMGRLLVQAAAERRGMQIAGGIAPRGRDYIGQDIGMVAGFGRALGVPVTDDLEARIADCDVVLDFSTREMSMEVARAATAAGKALVLGTTGFSEEERAAILKASLKIPMIFASNTSAIVNLMYALLEKTAQAAGRRADIEIIEMHDRDKLDAPSGTSKEMGRTIASALGKEFEELAVFGRSNMRGDALRKPGDIGYHSVRSGNISSSHTVIFGYMGERLEITHHAYDWMCCAYGALDAAAFLQGKKPGLYMMREVLGV